MNFAFGYPNSVAGTPGFFATGRRRDFMRHIIYFLIDKEDFNFPGIFVGNAFFELFFKLLLNNENNFVHPSLNCVIDRVINNGFSGWPDRINLFKPAVTASHSCRKD